MTLTLEDTSRIRWACRRGMRELDVLFEPFLDKRFANLSQEQQTHFMALLESNDQELWQWFFTDAKPEDPHLQSILKIIME